MWFTILKTLFSLTNYIAKYVGDRQLLDAGELKAIAHLNEKTLYKIKKAHAARHAIERIGVSDDPNNRDNH